MLKKVLITGGAGFIGSEIVRQLYNYGGWEVTVLDNLSTQIHGDNWKQSYLYSSIKDKCNFIKGSVCDLKKVCNAIGESEIIIHLAAETGTGQSMYLINQYNETNIMGTSNVFQAISNSNSQNHVKKIILSSSRAVYGEGQYLCTRCGVVYPRGRSKQRMLDGDFEMYCPNCGKIVQLIATTEDSKVSPQSLYAYTKYAQELMVRTMCPTMDIKYTILRFQNVYGPGQSLKNPYTGILSVFSNLLLDNKTVNVFEDGRESRDFVNVKDIATGVISCMKNENSNGETINLGSGSNTSVYSIASILKNNYKSQSEIKITGDFRIGDIANNKADISKAESILGYKPSISLDDGLKEFCIWVRKQKKGTLEFERSLNELEQAGMFIRKKETTNESN